MQLFWFAFKIFDSFIICVKEFNFALRPKNTGRISTHFSHMRIMRTHMRNWPFFMHIYAESGDLIHICDILKFFIFVGTLNTPIWWPKLAVYDDNFPLPLNTTPSIKNRSRVSMWFLSNPTQQNYIYIGLALSNHIK